MGEILDIKTGAVIHADEQQDPHITMQTIDRKVHIIPVSVIENIISGEMPITQMDDWEIIARTMLSVMLASIREGQDELH